jgi:peptidoglycan/xylan/chitin deacetylase (PgdA/CDA1 family)
MKEIIAIIVIFLWAILLGILTSCTKENVQPTSIVVTIDDAPIQNTEAMLNVLKKHNTKATFFCIGSEVNNAPDIILRMLKEGHIIANHSYSHPNFKRSDAPDLTEEVSTTQSILKKYGINTHYFRAPYGAISDEQTTYLQSLGYNVIGWDWNVEDWSNDVSLEEVKAYYTTKLNNNELKTPIVLFHLSNRAVEGLDWFLTELETRNIKVITLKDYVENYN